MLSLDLPFGKLEFTKTCGVILYHWPGEFRPRSLSRDV